MCKQAKQVFPKRNAAAKRLAASKNDAKVRQGKGSQSLPKVDLAANAVVLTPVLDQTLTDLEFISRFSLKTWTIAQRMVDRMTRIMVTRGVR
jgi:hypothetical protein